MYNPQDPFDPLTTLPATALNQMLDNIEAIHDGTGLADDAVTPAKINLGIPTSLTGLSLTTSSTTFVNFAGTPSITKTVNAGGVVLALFSAQLVGENVVVSVAASGANTAASNDEDAIYSSTVNSLSSGFRLFTGLTAGSTTFTLQGKSTGGTSQSIIRGKLTLIPLG